MSDSRNKLTKTDLVHLETCLQLAAEAVEAGDQPFGSVLVNAGGEVLARARNRINERNVLAHPEYELANWALENLSAEERAGCTMYTSGEHCPMCAAAHGWAGIGGLVYLSSAAQLGKWLKELDAPESPVNFYPVQDIIRKVEVRGPATGEFSDRIKKLHAAYHQK